MSVMTRMCDSGIAVAVLLTLIVASSAAAQDSADVEAVDAGREALQGPVDFPWYDAETDGLERVHVQPPADLENRKSQWEAKPSNWNWRWPRWWWQFLEVMGWTLLALFVGAVVYVLVKAFLARETGLAGGVGDEKVPIDTRGDADRVESLPFQIKRPKDDLLAEARRHYDAGNYREAIIYLYSYQLVQLDKYQFIRLTKGKTNRQYLREVRRQSDLFALLSRTMLAFEDVFFGNHDLERKRFELCWDGLDGFHDRLEASLT